MYSAMYKNQIFPLYDIRSYMTRDMNHVESYKFAYLE